MRTSPASPATSAGKACSTPGGASETSAASDHVSPAVVDDAKKILSGVPFWVPAFHNAYNVPAGSEAMVICAPRKPASPRKAQQSGAALEAVICVVFQVLPPSADRLV